MRRRSVGGCFPGSLLLTREYKAFSSFPGEYGRREKSGAASTWTTHRNHPGGKQSRKNIILEKKITEEIRDGRKKMTQKKKEKRRLWKRREPGKGEGSKGPKRWGLVGKDIRKLRQK